MSNLLDTGTDTDDRSPARPRHVPAKLEFKDCDPRQACRHGSFYEEVSTTSAEFTKESSLTIEDSFLDHIPQGIQSIGTVPTIRSKESAAFNNLSKRVHVDNC